MSHTYVIADIHGCYHALRQLLEKISPSADDTLVFLGDYIDRGPDSRQVVEYILSLKRQLPRLITLKGNHEQMLLDYLAGKERNSYLQHGGQQTLQSYGQRRDTDILPTIPPRHLHFFQELLSYWEDSNYIYVHAGIQPGIPLSQQGSKALLWGKGPFLETKKGFGKTVIYGHTHCDLPQVEENKIGIDTGAVYGGKLTCLVLPELKFLTVNCQSLIITN